MKIIRFVVSILAVCFAGSVWADCLPSRAEEQAVHETLQSKNYAVAKPIYERHLACYTSLQGKTIPRSMLIEMSFQNGQGTDNATLQRNEGAMNNLYGAEWQAMLGRKVAIAAGVLGWLAEHKGDYTAAFRYYDQAEVANPAGGYTRMKAVLRAHIEKRQLAQAK